MNIKIATILTVHNRKQKTLSCLQHLFEASEAYNQLATNPIVLTVFLTDDGCTDGTAESVMTTFTDKNIHIIKGDGNLFWAGGMRLAWQTAIDEETRWDFYLLLNDDTNVYDNVFDELFKAEEYCLQQTKKHGLISGITCHPNNKSITTYGGKNLVNKTSKREELLHATGVPQRIDLINANILLLNQQIVDTIGILYDGYKHAYADHDYSLTARRHGIFSYTTSHICGECVYDHDSRKSEIEKLCSMTFAERKKYVNFPTHCDHDYLLFIRRHYTFQFPIALLFHRIRLYWPGLYYHINKFRGVFK